MRPLLILLVGCGGQFKGSILPGEGDSCEEEGHCQQGLTCGHEGVCLEEGATGATEADGDCSLTAECAWELVCSADNVCVEDGAVGTGSEGDSCSSDEDCQAGHYCGDDGACVDLELPLWEGGTCPEDDLTGDFRPLFEVPDLPVSGEIDFYSLPFPNDLRLDTQGHPDLSGFPSPGDDTAVPDLVAAIESQSGWPRNPTIFFRFSRTPDFDTLRVDGDAPTIRFVSLDPDAPDYGDVSSLQYFTRSTRGKYICQNWLAVSVYDGRPLEEGHTYGVWITKSVTDRDGVTAVRDNGFKVMVQEDRPEDVDLGRAWDSFAPLRDYVTDNGVAIEDIAGATVFTTGYSSRGTRYFREVTQGDDVTVGLSDLVACDTGVVSPCDDGGARACEAADPDFTELHGLVSLPRYRTDGGSVAYDPTSLRPLVDGYEDVCVSMTVPTTEMPEGGWPVTLFQPDLGGTFRDAVTTGLAGDLAVQGVATIGVELPGHGARGDSYIDTSNLQAWLGNMLQASADPEALVRLAQEWSVDADASPTGTAIAFDPDEIWYAGQGEAAAVGTNFLAWSLDTRGAVLGNPSGYMIHRFADEDTPIDVEHGLMTSLGDSALTRWHPALNLLQAAFEGVDPVNNGMGVTREPSTEAKHLLVVHGVNDEATPELALVSGLRALYLPTAGDVLDDYGQSTTTFPVYENVSTEDGRRTAASVQVDAGHDALLTAEGVFRAASFIGSGIGGSPTIEE